MNRKKTYTFLVCLLAAFILWLDMKIDEGAVKDNPPLDMRDTCAICKHRIK